VILLLDRRKIFARVLGSKPRIVAGARQSMGQHSAFFGQPPGMDNLPSLLFLS